MSSGLHDKKVAEIDGSGQSHALVQRDTPDSFGLFQSPSAQKVFVTLDLPYNYGKQEPSTKAPKLVMTKTSS